MTSAEQAYLFRHAVVRDAAYALHLPSERSELHRLAIGAIGDADAFAGELADHAMCAQDGAAAQSVSELQAAEKAFRERAARYAAQRDATPELVEHMLRLADLPQPTVKARIDCLAKAGSALMGMGRLDRAEAIALRMNELARQAGDRVQEARSLRALMAVEATVGKSELADAHLRESLAILEQLGDAGELASTLRAFALHTMSRGRYEESQQWIERAMPFSHGNDAERALLLDTRGGLEASMGRHTEALASYRESIRLSLKAGNPSKARDTRTGVATCLLELGRLEEAEAEARALLIEFTRSARVPDQTAMHALLAAILSRRGDHASAVGVYHEVLRARREQGAVWHLIDAFVSLADALCNAGRFDEALPYASEAMRHSREQDNLSGIARAHALRGWIRQSQGRLAEAERELAEAARLQERLSEAGRAEQVRARLSEVRRQLGR